MLFSPFISDEENDVLNSLIDTIRGPIITFNTGYKEKEIYPIKILRKLKENLTDVIIYMLDAKGEKIGYIKYKKCKIEINYDDFLNFHTSAFGIDFDTKKKMKIMLLRPEEILFRYNQKDEIDFDKESEKF